MGEIKQEVFFGTCKWFNVRRGFGFIQPDGETRDIFVHQSQLKMDGFRSLNIGEKVRFSINERQQGPEAINVTSALEGQKLRGSSIKPTQPTRWTLIRCFKCGRYGRHTAATCKNVLQFGKACYGCHATDHLAADCPKKQQQKYDKKDNDEKVVADSNAQPRTDSSDANTKVVDNGDAKSEMGTGDAKSNVGTGDAKLKTDNEDAKFKADNDAKPSADNGDAKPKAVDSSIAGGEAAAPEIAVINGSVEKI